MLFYHGLENLSYFNKKLVDKYHYIKCDESCKTCEYEATMCKECNNDFHPLSSEILKKSKRCYDDITHPLGYYLNNNVYKKCSDNCLECSQNSNNCISCKKKIDPINGYCPKNDYYKNKCYITCSTCSSLGDLISNDCIECAVGYKPNPSTPGKCIRKCVYFFICESGICCTDTAECNEDSSLEIPEEKKCVNNCTKLDKIQYNGQCLDNCPENTILSNGICTDIDSQKCFQRVKSSNLTFEEINRKKSKNLITKIILTSLITQ